MSRNKTQKKPRFEVLGATCGDEKPLFELAALLDTVNLPHHRPAIQALLSHAEGSFTAQVELCRAKFVFLLWDNWKQRAVGTSTLIAQLGTREAPYLYFDVIDEERYSRSQDLHFHHTLLRLGSSFSGPTELGGLVLHPEFRGNAERLGRFISFVRFTYIASAPECFQLHLLAELMPPLLADGRSHLWEALGRRFTNMTYAQADLLSSQDKEFITDLFPRGLINTSLLSPEAKAVVGKVGPATQGVERMLRAIGFRSARRVDPFDGGPHFIAETRAVTPISHTRRGAFAGVLESQPPAAIVQRGLILQRLDQAPHVRCVQGAFACAPAHGKPPGTVCSVFLDESLRSHWQLQYNQPLFVTPL